MGNLFPPSFNTRFPTRHHPLVAWQLAELTLASLFVPQEMIGRMSPRIREIDRGQELSLNTRTRRASTARFRNELTQYDRRCLLDGQRCDSELDLCADLG
jgi:hypothetical protein